MNRRPGIAVGLTGGLACGKSEVGRCLRKLGAVVIEADDVAHALMRPGRPVYRRVVRRFGPGIVAADGSLDRVALGRRVFRDPREREQLNRLVHPVVLKTIRRRRMAEQRRGRAVVAIIPLLFEVGETRGWNAVIAVSAPRAHVQKRLKARGFSERESRQRMRAQMPVMEKMRRATHVIRNNGTRAELNKKTRMVWNEILQQETRTHARFGTTQDAARSRRPPAPQPRGARDE